MNLTSIISLSAGGPGSGRKPEAGSKQAKRLAWLDPRQLSIYGPEHSKEIRKNAKQGKTRDDLKGGGPGSGRHAELDKMYQVHDAIRNSPEANTREKFSQQQPRVMGLLKTAMQLDRDHPDLQKAQQNADRASSLAGKGNHKLASAYLDTALALVHRWLDSRAGVPHGWRRSAIFASRGWIGFDLDNTIAKQLHPFDSAKVGPPIRKMLHVLKTHLAAGDNVKIFTARAGDMVAERAINNWCREHVGRTLPITNKKDHFMVKLYDDRAVNPKDIKAEYSPEEARTPAGSPGGGQWTTGGGGLSEGQAKDIAGIPSKKTKAKVEHTDPAHGDVFNKSYKGVKYQLEAKQYGTGSIKYELKNMTDPEGWKSPKIFTSPSSAAQSLTEHAINGWKFWGMDKPQGVVKDAPVTIPQSVKDANTAEILTPPFGYSGEPKPVETFKPASTPEPAKTSGGIPRLPFSKYNDNKLGQWSLNHGVSSDSGWTKLQEWALNQPKELTYGEITKQYMSLVNPASKSETTPSPAAKAFPELAKFHEDHPDWAALTPPQPDADPSSVSGLVKDASLKKINDANSFLPTVGFKPLSLGDHKALVDWSQTLAAKPKMSEVAKKLTEINPSSYKGLDKPAVTTPTATPQAQPAVVTKMPRAQLLKTVDDFAKSVGGYQNLKMPHGSDDKKFAGGMPDTYKNLVNLYKQLGMEEDDLVKHAGRIYSWSSSSSEAFAKIAQAAVYGKNFTDNATKAMAVEYAVTQGVLKKELGEFAVLYRGIAGEYANKAWEDAKDRTVFGLATKGADSWTSKKDFAQNWNSNGIVIQNTWPISQVVTSHLSNRQMHEAHPSEHEFVVVAPGHEYTLEDAKVTKNGKTPQEYDPSDYMAAARNKKPLIFDVTDDVNFNWLHSRRTPEQKRKDRIVMQQFKQRIAELERRERKQSMQAYGTSQGMKKAWDTRGRGKNTMDERSEKKVKALQSIKLPSGATLYIGAPVGPRKPMTQPLHNTPAQVQVTKGGNLKTVVRIPAGRLWPEQAEWKGGTPSVDKHTLNGKFGAAVKDASTLSLVSGHLMGKTSVYQATQPSTDKGATVISTRDSDSGNGRIIEFNHDATSWSKQKETDEWHQSGGKLQYNTGGRTSDLGSKGGKLLPNLGSTHVIRFSSKLAQDSFLRQRYGIDK